MTRGLLHAAIGAAVALVLMLAGGLAFKAQQCAADLDFQKKAEKYFQATDSVVQFLTAQAKAQPKPDATGTANPTQ